jgi:hypothetical protein
LNAAKKIILLLWLLIVASLGNVSASTPGATENRVWQKSFSPLETRQAEPTQTAGRHQENGVAGYDYAVDCLLAAETAPSIEAQLQTHLDNAVARFDQEGFTPNQAAALVENPNLGAAYRGSQIDTFFKESVSADANLQNLQITPRFKFGPDVFDPANNVWYDVTTPAQWQNHVLKYTPGFGQGVPLFH